MIDNPDRVEQFTDEIAEMRLPGSRSSRDRVLSRAGAVLMVLGVLTGVAAYFIGHGTTNPLQQRDAIVIAVLGLTVAVVGAAMFLRYSLAQFLRFWLARSSWEEQARMDQLTEALRSSD
ncbi:MAG: hypothetical protein KDB31_10945 [Microthrixaceae bacterium]|nr:hypothetical protein [Microthrixaceae bacterium]